MTPPHEPWHGPPGPQPWGGPPPNPYAAPPTPAGPAPARPVTVEIAFWIAVVVPLVAVVLYALSFLLTQGLVQRALAAEFAGAEQQRTAVQLAGGLMVVFFAVVLFVLAVLTALWITFGFKLRAGRNWARITLTVFAVFWALAGVSGLVNGGLGWAAGELPAGVAEPGGLLALAYGQNALALLAMAAFVVLVHVPRSQRYFAASGMPR